MKIASFDEPRPRGTVIGKQINGPRLSEAENYFRCDRCGGWFDARDLVWVKDHEGPLLRPASDLACSYSAAGTGPIRPLAMQNRQPNSATLNVASRIDGSGIRV
jgi:hypothetical protein